MTKKATTSKFCLLDNSREEPEYFLGANFGVNLTEVTFWNFVLPSHHAAPKLCLSCPTVRVLDSAKHHGIDNCFPASSLLLRWPALLGWCCCEDALNPQLSVAHHQCQDCGSSKKMMDAGHQDAKQVLKSSSSCCPMSTRTLQGSWCICWFQHSKLHRWLARWEPQWQGKEFLSQFCKHDWSLCTLWVGCAHSLGSNTAANNSAAAEHKRRRIFETLFLFSWMTGMEFCPLLTRFFTIHAVCRMSSQCFLDVLLATKKTCKTNGRVHPVFHVGSHQSVTRRQEGNGHICPQNPAWTTSTKHSAQVHASMGHAIVLSAEPVCTPKEKWPRHVHDN